MNVVSLSILLSLLFSCFADHTLILSDTVESEYDWLNNGETYQYWTRQDFENPSVLNKKENKKSFHLEPCTVEVNGPGNSFVDHETHLGTLVVGSNDNHDTSIFIGSPGRAEEPVVLSLSYDEVPVIEKIERSKLCTGETALEIFGMGFGFDPEGIIVTVTMPKDPNDNIVLDDSCTYPRSQCPPSELEKDPFEIFYCTDVQLTFHDEQIQCIILDYIAPSTKLEVTVTSLFHYPPVYATHISE